MNIYSFDKTIYDGNSTKDFIIYCLKKNKKCLLVLPKFLIIYILYLIKIYEIEKVKSTILSIIKYFDDINNIVLEFWEKKNYKLKEFYLKQKKDNDIVISSSPEFLLKSMSKKHNFKIIGTKVNTRTGEIIGKNCCCQEKKIRLNELGIKKCSKFYTSSLEDSSIKNISNKSYIVKCENIIEWDNYKESSIKKIKKIFFNRDFITFVFIGVINAFNGIWISYVYSFIISNAIVAYIIGFFTSLCISYILNSLLNFKMNLSWINLVKYAINNLPNLIIQIITVIILLNIVKTSKLISYSISAVVAVPITFILVKYNVFKSKKCYNVFDKENNFKNINNI